MPRNPGSGTDDTLPAIGSGQLAGSGPRPRLPVGTVLAGRYVVRHHLATGGMGEVYEAEDRELSVRLALKTLGEYGATGATIERFKREIQLARMVTHENVCRIFDFGSDAPAGVAFLTMELLEGETLADWIAREGSLTPERALPLVRQMAAGLHAAHVAGVVHRDFKPRNVMLVRHHDELRVVVTDFGLAVPESSDVQLTGPGTTVGTPGYMAPEQVIGSHALSPATDVYALGIVIFEMVTGRLPFEGNHALETAALRVTKRPSAPRLYAPNLDPRWEAAILRCLALEPGDRFASVADLVRALEADAPAQAFPPVARRARWPWAMALGACAVAAGAIWMGTRFHEPRPSTSPAAPPPGPAATPTTITAAPRYAAVVGFANASNRADAAWLSPALTEGLTAELAVGGIVAFSGESIATATRDLAITDPSRLDVAALGRLRRRLGADVVVSGAHTTSEDGQTRVEIRVADAASGVILTSFAIDGAASDLPALLAQAGARLRFELGLRAPVDPALLVLRGLFPATAAAARAYYEGLALLRALKADEALAALDRAVAADPEFPLAHAARARALVRLGQRPLARGAAATAFTLRGSLVRAEQLKIEGLHQELENDGDAAIDTYRALARVYPDDLQYRLVVAVTQNRFERSKQAMATIDEMRQLPPPQGDDPEIDAAEARAALQLSDYPRCVAAATRTAERAVARGARVLEVDARNYRAHCLVSQGKGADAIADAQAAGRIAREVDYAYGRFLSSEVLAAIHEDAGNLVAAKGAYAEALVACKQTHGSCVAEVEGNQGVLALHLGDLDEAAALLGDSLASFTDMGARSSIASLQLSLAELAAERGQLAQAERAFDDVRTQLAELGEQASIASALSGRARVLRLRGDAAAARKLTDQAAAIDEKLGNPENVFFDRLDQARLLADDGHPAEALALARRALADLPSTAPDDDRAQANALIAELALAAGDAAAARQAAEEARRQGHASQRRQVRLLVALAAGRVLGDAPALEAARADASAAGFAVLALDCRDALARLALAAGRRDEARVALDAVRRDAAALGYVRLARISGP